ncbi:uncharacterized protein LOC118205240 [Stegodyphus dumicola]|uniref:uncharacterized protein LOC118205240 n=1 Tax=Stegodyphus dumicola TaxID=202533 RepID=UPI0015B37D2D|nr:uncharacterized protein LOC118205240 [Stegodyphus dumicola]
MMLYFLLLSVASCTATNNSSPFNVLNATNRHSTNISEVFPHPLLHPKLHIAFFFLAVHGRNCSSFSRFCREMVGFTDKLKYDTNLTTAGNASINYEQDQPWLRWKRILESTNDLAADNDIKHAPTVVATRLTESNNTMEEMAKGNTFRNGFLSRLFLHDPLLMLLHAARRNSIIGPSIDVDNFRSDGIEHFFLNNNDNNDSHIFPLSNTKSVGMQPISLGKKDDDYNFILDAKDPHADVQSFPSDENNDNHDSVFNNNQPSHTSTQSSVHDNNDVENNSLNMIRRLLRAYEIPSKFQ